ncbi:gene transfer agent (GTA) [Methylobacterium variabile]|uniref:Gene transfer agent (GTA) n=1 Tax=Methylobacterium variabile TaxID=298794 RepID=A0A0J6T0R4_9HYPH|nr:glycoside hydrolase/phage tail family protein [Methylobacterium variabile]KMO39178.1 gene transfer agent (GTA) [Methylobacterium variabile]
MSTLVLSYAGQAVGTALGGPIGGAIGRVVGAAGGSALDHALFGGRQKPVVSLGPRIADLYVTASSEGAAVPRVYGRVRVAGQIIWATKVRETQSVEKVRGSGGKGGGAQPKTYTVTYSYTVSVAVGLCEGPITGLGRVWADGRPIRLADYSHRLYRGGEDQLPDPKIEAVEGAAPAYRGLAYLVLEDLALGPFGNRVPVITAEVIRRPPSHDGRPRLEELVTAVTLIPAMGEFVYATKPVVATGLGTLQGQNTVSGGPDLVAALDQLQEEAPACRHVSLVVAWQGSDLRLSACRIAPRAETAAKVTSGQTWVAAGLTREAAGIVSRDAEGHPLIGGAPADLSVVQAIRELKRRGLAVTLYPFVMMDIPAGNGLPDPYGRPEQPPFPWRGRITGHPAPGHPGTVDKTQAAADQVAAFFGDTQGGDLAWTGATVASRRPDEWGFRRFILTCARLAEAAGGVDAFLIGSEMVGLTTLRSGPATFPGVAALRRLAADVRAILGPGTALTYGADWTEYANYRPADGTGDVLFHLDPLWADPNIDAIGIDNYMPLADWREGFDHADARAGFASPCDPAYLRANVAGGELHDWFYASPADREGQVRTPIRDTAHGEDWVFRLKDLRAWWENPHHDRPGGVRAAAPTAWVLRSKPLRFTELGCPAIDKGMNQPNVFLDPKSAESVTPHFSLGRRDLAVQRAYLEAVLAYWREDAHNPVSPLYGGRMLDWERIAVWTWDARPFPDFPRQSGVWRDADNYRLGHWINGRLGLAPLADVVAELCAGVPADVSGLFGMVEGYAITEPASARASLGPLQQVFPFEAAESGGRVVFHPLARPPALRLTPDGLVAGRDGASDYTRTRAEAGALPGSVALSYLDPGRDYRGATVEARRPGGAPGRTAVSVPLALDEGAASGVAQGLLQRAALEREALTGALPPSCLALDPGDVIAVDLDGRRTEYRLTRLGLEAGRPFEAVRTEAGLHAGPDGGLSRRDPDPPALPGIGLVALLDLPTLRAAPQPLLLAAYTEPWAPLAAELAPEGGAFVPDAVIPVPTIIGRLAAPLAAGPRHRWDRRNTVEVELPRGAQLAAATERAVLDGANVAAVETPAGRWEVLQWTECRLTGPGRYRLGRLLRGQLGSDADMVGLLPAGSRFVVLGESLAPSGLDPAERRPHRLRIGPQGRPPTAPSWIGLGIVPQALSLRPLAPVQARLRRIGDGDLRVSWIRRTRIDGDPWEQVEVPLAEEAEAYALDVLSGSTVLRTLAVTAPAVTYTAAHQAADFGGPVTSLSVAIHQLSATYGRGAALRATLYV